MVSFSFRWSEEYLDCGWKVRVAPSDVDTFRRIMQFRQAV